MTLQQASLLQRRLGLPVVVGMRFAEPGLPAALGKLVELGAERVIVLPLAPFSVPLYHAAAVAARDALALESRLQLVSVASWGTTPALVAAQVAQIRAAPGHATADAIVLTAHSLPLSVIRAGDRYAEQVGAAAAAIAAELDREVLLAYQSRSGDAAAWLGPHLPDVLRTLSARGVRRLLVAPVGFLAEHVETLYDLDVGARHEAAVLGLEFERVPALGTATALIEVMAAVVQDAVAAAQ